jgi:WD40 repeat protein
MSQATVHKPRSFMLMTALLIASLLLTGCDRTPGTLTPAVTDTIPATQPPTTSEIPATTSAPTDDPTAEPGSTPIPSPSPGDVIGPDNLGDLETIDSITSEETGFMTWVGEDSLALASEQKVQIFQREPIERLADIDAGERPTVLAGCPNKDLVAWAGYDSYQIFLLDELVQTEPVLLAEMEGPVTSLAFSPDGEILAAAGYDNTITLFHVPTREQIDAWQFPSWITDLTFSPDGTQLAGVEAQAFTVHIWDAKTGEELNRLLWEDHAAPVLYGVAFSPDWQKAAWVARGTVLVMDMNTGAEIAMMGHEDFVNSITWSPDSRLLVTSAAGTVGGQFSPLLVVWDPETGEQLDMLVTTTPAMEVAFSPDGSEMASLHSDGVVLIWGLQP